MLEVDTVMVVVSLDCQTVSSKGRPTRQACRLDAGDWVK